MSEPSVNEIVINYILKMLKNRSGKENYKLPTESEIAEQLCVSRNSVREALKTLQNIGIIYSIRGSGYKMEPDLETSLLKTAQTLFEIMSDKYNYKDIRDVREALELKTILLLQQQQLEGSDIELLCSYVENMKNNIEPDENDKKFHFKLASMTNNSLLKFISRAILLRTADHYIIIPWDQLEQDSKQRNELIKSHEEIIDWITNKINPTIIAANPITNHYTVADEIIAEKNKQNNGELENYTISELLKMGITDDKINELVMKLRNQNI